MKKIFIFTLFSALCLTSCLKHDFPDYEESNKEKIDENVSRIFGTTFDENHDWCTTANGEINIVDIPSDVDRVQVLAYVKEEDGETSILVLNEIETEGESSVVLNYDAPINNLGLYVAFISTTNFNVVKVESNTVSFNSKASTRALGLLEKYTLPSVQPVIGVIEDSYASKRGWIPGEKLYSMSDYTSQRIQTEDYTDEMKIVFRAVIFSYFKNGRNYNNLPLVIESGLYNESAYPFTTGKEPIIVSPVYKCDKAKQYGNEVYNSDLYYYYYKGDITREELEMLPKYKAIPFNEYFGETEDDNIEKKCAYVLVYWGNEIPTIGTVGSYQFPEGYNIGFMVRAKTDFKENGKPRKQGELYADGRLNNYINSKTYANDWNFKSSGFGEDAPRAAWITVNDKMLLCFESGTDKDFNDVILEVEGGVKPIINIPDIESNFYTFCFEDTELGDYDMNDVVIKARRVNTTSVEYQIVACGAFDELKIMNINGSIINNTKEVHSMFGVDGGYINTALGGTKYNPVVETITVDSKFSFLDEATQPYIVDETTGLIVKLSKKGEDPHGIMIPTDFKYPIEKVCIKDAYLQFNNWGQNRITSTDWYKYPTELVY